MALKKGIDVKWRLFVPVVISFWLIIICMASWQIYRVSELKKEFVYDQMKMVCSRLVDIYNTDQIDNDLAENQMLFYNDYYRKQNNYDPMSFQVRDNSGKILVNIGNIVNDSTIHLPSHDSNRGVVKFTQREIESNEDDIDINSDVKYLYYKMKTENDNSVIVLLPYTRQLAETLSSDTARFWLIFFGIAVFVTISAYLSTHYFSRNIKLLRNFADNAANNPDFVISDTADFPHDELGDISRQIINIYNQRMDEMARREREHRVALNAVEEKNRIKRELTGNINHELKTPVGVIQGYIDTIIDNPGMDVETRDKFLFKTQENVHRLSAIIADITAITKLESGGKLVNVEELDLHDLLFTFDNFITENDLLKGKMKFHFDVPLNCRVMANNSMLQSVLTNFVKNSLAYSEGTECALVMTGEDDNFVHLAFYDDGIGVPPEHLPHMFERFYRVNAGRSRDTGGTGLGLAIVEVTIKSFGGEIDCLNRFPSGLEFRFTLPKAKKGEKIDKQDEQKA